LLPLACLSSHLLMRRQTTPAATVTSFNSAFGEY